MPESLETTPREAQLQLNEKGRAVLIDVREPAEFAMAHVPGSSLLPMQQIPAELQQLDEMADEKTLLVLCHHGVRSLQVVAWLRDKGVENCYSIAGGIDRWSREVDGSIPQY